MIRRAKTKADTSKYMTPSSAVNDVSAVNTYYFEKIYNLCKENNIEMIIVSVPSICYWSYAKHNGVSQLAEEYGVQYWDFNIDEELNIDWSKETPDKGKHLNISGAKKLTSRIGAMLSEKTTVELVDHRGDTNFDVWNEGWKEFEKLL